MASITPAEAALLSVPEVPGRYFLDCRPTDQLFDLLPFKAIAGHELRLNVVNASGTGLALFADPETAGSALNSSMPTITSRTTELKRIAAEMPVSSIIPNIYGSHRDSVQAQISLKVDAVRDKFKQLLIEGSVANAGEFDGLRVFATASGNSIGADSGAANGGTVAKGEIEELLVMVRPRRAGLNTVLAMNSEAYSHLARNNYQDFEYATHPLLGTVPVLAGAPVLIDDFIPVTETKGTSNDTTSIYAIVLGNDEGVGGIYPASAQAQPIQVRGPVVKESTDTMWYHVSWDVAVAFYNKCAVARLSGVKQSN